MTTDDDVNAEPDSRPLIAHVIHRLDVGGLENGLVNLINRMPGHFRHAVISLTDYTDFHYRIERDDVTLHALHKQAGKNPRVYLQLWRLLRQLSPAICHTRNLAALEAQLPAALAAVPARVHGEHGWDMADLDGSRAKYLWLRRVCRPLVHRYIALSHHIQDYLTGPVGVPQDRMEQIYNGVDTARFRPTPNGRGPLPVSADFAPSGTIVIGTVGRQQQVKDPLTLARAFVELIQGDPALRDRLRLVVIGDGPLREQVRQELDRGGALELAWLPGSRDDIPELLQGMDIFVLPSLAEGISNTILEAMATGLPVVATDVGGNPELVDHSATGMLVPPADPLAMSEALHAYLDQPAMIRGHGRAGRARVEQKFSLEVMVARYTAVYDRLTAATGVGLQP